MFVWESNVQSFLLNGRFQKSMNCESKLPGNGLLQQNLMAWSGLEPLSPTKISLEKLQTTRENSGAQAGLRKFFSRILYCVAWVFANSSRCFYTCQLFLRYKHEIFILGVLGFLKMTRSFPKIPEEVQSLPKMSEVCRRRSYRENAYPQNQRSWGRYCHLFILHMVFVPYMGLS